MTMHRVTLFFTCTIIFNFCLIFIFSGICEGKHYALVIGNSAYKDAPLQNPVNDAGDVAAALKRLDFHVLYKENATQRAMEESVHEFGELLKKGDVGLFYYAGHGMQVEGNNYLIPVDHRIRSLSDVKYEALNVGRILGTLEEADNGFNIIILDACRNNPLGRHFNRSFNRGLAVVPSIEGAIIVYSTAPGEVAADGAGDNGLFTSMLLKHIFTPNLEIGQLFRRVRIDVRNASDGAQVPWTEESLIGHFYFNRTDGRNRTDKDLSVVPEANKGSVQVASLQKEKPSVDVSEKWAEPAENKAIGEIAAVNWDWHFITISLSNSDLKTGESVYAYHQGVRYALKIARIYKSSASALPDEPLSEFIPGMKIYKY